jgi:hypothetical protein
MMNEPSLYDVLSRVVTGRRVVKAALIVLGAWLAYDSGANALLPGATPTLTTWVDLGLGLVLVLLGLLLADRGARWAALQQWATAEDGGRKTEDGQPAVTRLPSSVATAATAPTVNLRRFAPLGGLALAILAQFQLAALPDQWLTGLGLWAVAGALFVWGLWPDDVARRNGVVAPASLQVRGHGIVIVTGLVLGVASFLTAGGHQYTPAVVLPWLLSVVLVAVGWMGLTPGQVMAWVQARWSQLAAIDVRQSRLSLSTTVLAVLMTLTVGTFLRFYELNDIPREMTSDHIEKLFDVNDVLTGLSPIFFERNTGREPLQFYYTAALMRLFDIPLSHLALKIGTALAGSATLIFVFLLARELAGTEIGLWAMLLSAIARWPIALSRAGLRYPFAPLFLAAALFFFVRGLRSGRRSDFLWAGLFTGIGLHGYTSFRVEPMLLIVLAVLWLLLLWRLQDEEDRLAFMRNLVAMGSLVLVCVLPMMRYMVDNPQMFWYRVLSRVSNTEQALPGSPVELLAENLRRVFLMFNYTGDAVWTVNVSGSIALSPFLAALFGLGFLYMVVRAIQRDKVAVCLLAGWVLLLLPSGLSLAFPGENPSLARAGISFPIVMIIAAWPLLLVRKTLSGAISGRLGRALAAVALTGGLGVLAQRELNDYYVVFAQQYAQSATNPAEVGAVVRAYVAGGVRPENVWLKGYPFWLDTRSVSLESFDTIGWNNAMLEVPELARAGTEPTAKLFIVHIYDRESIAELRRLYPEGRLILHASPTPGKEFLTYFVPGLDDFDESLLPVP